jgi:hypothetical protein
MQDLAKLLILFGIVSIVVGGALLLAGRVPFIGRLPGDFTFSTGGFTCFFPLATSIIISIILTVLLNILFRVINR